MAIAAWFLLKQITKHRGKIGQCSEALFETVCPAPRLVGRNEFLVMS